MRGARRGAGERLAADLTASFERFNRATDGTLVAQAEYLEVVAVEAGERVPV